MATSKFRVHRTRQALCGIGLSLVLGIGLLVTAPASIAAVPAGDPDPEHSTPAQALALADSTDSPVEVTSMTTETNQVLARPGGLFELQSNREPVRTDIHGDWEPIDTTLQVNDDGTISPAATTLPVTFSPGGDSEAVTAGEGDDAITFAWGDGDLPTPTVTGSQITYPDVRPGVDLVFTANASGYSDALVVKTPAAAQGLQQDPAEFTGTSTGLDLSTTSDGTLVGSNPDTGTTLVSPPPVAWDSSGGGQGDDHPDADSSGTAKVNELPQTVVDTSDSSAGSSVTLAVAPTVATTDNPATTYPLYLDPQIGGKLNAHFLTVHSKGWDYYDAQNQVMRVGYCGWSECNTSTQGDARSFFSFDISPLTVAGADPHVYDATVKAQQVWNASSADEPVNLTKATHFDGGYNYPGPVGASLQQISDNAGYGGNNEKWLAFSNANVLSYVQAAATNEDKSLEFSLSAPSAGNKYYWKKFNNNTYLTVIFAYPPSISSYTATGVVACAGYPVYSRGSIRMQEAATEITGSTQSYGIDYAFQIFKNDASNNGPWDGTTLTSSTGWINNQFVTITGLTNGTYAWRAGATDYVENGDTATSHTYAPDTRWTDAGTRPFTVDTTKPSPATITSDDYPENYWGRSAASPGTFKIAVPSDAVAVAYAFNGAPAPLKDIDCTYSGAGYATPSGSQATIAAPTLNPGVPNTLSVYTFDRAHNPSTTTTYTFYVSRDLPGTTTTNRVEAESPSISKTTTGSATVSADVAANAALPGTYATMSAADPADSVDLNLNITQTGYYAIGAKLGGCAACGRVQLSIPDSQVLTPTPVDTSSQAQTGPTYVQLGGYNLSQGIHKVHVTFPDASTGAPSTGMIDYLTVAQIQAGGYGAANGTLASNLAAAFNNDGITTAGGPAASLDNTSAYNALSAAQLAQMGITQGSSYPASFVDHNGLSVSATFAVPAATAQGDNVISAGQRIVMPAGTIANHVDFLVAATCGTVADRPGTRFDLVHQPATGGTVTTSPGLSSAVPSWLDPNPDTDLTAITLPGYLTGATAVATTGTNRLYVLEIDVDPSHRTEPLTSVTLPSTGTSLTRGCTPGTSAPMLHVLAMTTR